MQKQYVRHFLLLLAHCHAEHFDVRHRQISIAELRFTQLTLYVHLLDKCSFKRFHTHDLVEGIKERVSVSPNPSSLIGTGIDMKFQRTLRFRKRLVISFFMFEVVQHEDQAVLVTLYKDDVASAP